MIVGMMPEVAVNKDQNADPESGMRRRGALRSP
jgi:hypothetical protein